jgi:hypothetical protein
MKQACFALGATLLIGLGGCDTGRNDLLGEWRGEQNGLLMTVTFDPDSTFTMDTGTFVGEGTFSADPEGRIVMAPTGALAVSVPGGFTASIQDWTLNLCGPGGRCSDFERPE